MPPDATKSPAKRGRGTRWLDATLIVYWLCHVMVFHWPPRRLRLPSIGQHPWDWMVHGSAYALLAGLLAAVVEAHAAGRPQAAAGRTRRLILCWLAVAAYGLCDELTQPLTHRSFDLLDWCADMTGAAVGILFYVFSRPRRPTVD